MVKAVVTVVKAVARAAGVTLPARPTTPASKTASSSGSQSKPAPPKSSKPTGTYLGQQPSYWSPSLGPTSMPPIGNTSGAMDGVHLLLDLLGLVPGVGPFADGTNAAIYTSEGNYRDAAISSASIVLDGAIILRFAKEPIEATVKAAETGHKATKSAPGIKAGSMGDPTAGKPFSPGVRQQELANNPSTCCIAGWRRIPRRSTMSFLGFVGERDGGECADDVPPLQRLEGS